MNNAKSQMIFSIPVQLVSVVIVVLLIFGSTVFIWMIKSSTAFSYVSSLSTYDAPQYSGVISSFRDFLIFSATSESQEDFEEISKLSDVSSQYLTFLDSFLAGYVLTQQYPLEISLTYQEQPSMTLYSYAFASKAPSNNCIPFGSTREQYSEYISKRDNSNSQKQTLELVHCSTDAIAHSVLGSSGLRNSNKQISQEFFVVEYPVFSGELQ
jgi:hypothetical protein